MKVPTMKENKPRLHSLCGVTHIHGECPGLDKEKLERKKELAKLPSTSPECQVLSATMRKHCTQRPCDNPMHESNKNPGKSYKRGELLDA